MQEFLDEFKKTLSIGKEIPAFQKGEKESISCSIAEFPGKILGD